VADHTLLNNSHRGYFKAAKAQETSHLAFLELVRTSQGGSRGSWRDSWRHSRHHRRRGCGADLRHRV
jgi:hypothetical protein